jgi:hypothetical protein
VTTGAEVKFGEGGGVGMEVGTKTVDRGGYFTDFFRGWRIRGSRQILEVAGVVVAGRGFRAIRDDLTVILRGSRPEATDDYLAAIRNSALDLGWDRIRIR